MKKYVAIVVGIGFAHRLLLLGARQLWTDELMQARIIKAASPAQILSRLQGGMDLASPLDYFLQRSIAWILGYSPWALRLHAVIFGTLSIWLFYRISRFLFGERVALYSTILFAFYPLAYHYSQEARPYALLLFLTLLSYDLLFRQLWSKDRPWQGWLLIAGVSTLLLYASCLGFLIIFSQLTGLLLAAIWKPAGESVPSPDIEAQRGTDPRSVSWSQVITYVLTALTAMALFYPWLRLIWEKPLLAPVGEIADPKLVLRMIKELGDNSYPMSGLLLIGLITGIRVLLRHRRRRSLTWLLTWFLVPIPVLLAAEVWAGYFFAIRHILHATPPLLLIAGYGLSYVGERLAILEHLPHQVSSPALVYAGLLILGAVWIGQSHSRSEPADWMGTAAFLTQTVRDGDAVSVPAVYPLLEYYDPGLDAHRVQDLDPGAGSLASAEIKRRIVVCYDKLWPDPCDGFRPAASKDPAWMQRSLTGFSLFLRTK